MDAWNRHVRLRAWVYGGLIATTACLVILLPTYASALFLLMSIITLVATFFVQQDSLRAQAARDTEYRNSLRQQRVMTAQAKRKTKEGDHDSTSF